MKQYIYGTLASLGIALLNSTVASAVSLSFVPASQTLPLGNTASVNLVIDGLGDQNSLALGAFDLNVNFDPNLLSPSQVTFGNQLDLGILGSIQSWSLVSPGIININEISLEDANDLINGQPSSFLIASLTFNTLALGSSPLTLSPPSLFSSIILGDENGNSITLSSISDGSITIIPNSRPIPESSYPLGIIVAGILFIGTNKRVITTQRSKSVLRTDVHSWVKA